MKDTAAVIGLGLTFVVGMSAVVFMVASDAEAVVNGNPDSCQYMPELKSKSSCANGVRP